MTELVVHEFGVCIEEFAECLLDEAISRSNMRAVRLLLVKFTKVSEKSLVNILKYVNLRQAVMLAKWTIDVVDHVFRLVFDKFKLDLAFRLPNNKSLFSLCFEFEEALILR
jgi:hypothetical protein